MVDIMWIQQGYAGDTMKSDVTNTCNCQDLGVTENEDTHKQWHLKWRTWWWIMEFSVFHIFSHAHGATSQYSNLAFVRHRIWSSRTWRSVQKMSKASWYRLFVSESGEFHGIAASCGHFSCGMWWLAAVVWGIRLRSGLDLCQNYQGVCFPCFTSPPIRSLGNETMQSRKKRVW